MNKVNEVDDGNGNAIPIYQMDLTPPCKEGSVEVIGFDGTTPAIKCKEQSTGKDLFCNTSYSAAFQCFYIQ